MKILWLCSWYPHREQPYEGDFIQRHAGAVSAYSLLTVFYVSQDGPAVEVAGSEFINRQYREAKEKIIYFRFKKTGVPVLDKLLYNYKYYRTYKKHIATFIAGEGKPDIVHVHVPMKAGVIARWIKKRYSIPYILSEHSSHYNGNTDDDYSKRSGLYQSQTRRVFKDAAMVTNVSMAVGNKLKDLFGLNEVRIVRNTVDTDVFFNTPVQAGTFRFIHVSTLSAHQKNLEGIFNAFQSLLKMRRDFELVVVGPASDEIKMKIVKSTLARFVRFTGEITYGEVAKEMRASSAFVLFSRYENFPCVIIEALCCGLPVITSGTGGSSEAIDDTNGIVVESENEPQLVAALNNIIDNYDQYDRGQIAERAQRTYSYQVIGKQFYELYQQLVSHP
jgi:glycosyltransferase involved in cell wall biosynthesis